eukprot:scaffold18111_cov46-Phaeocystis_antarctica.AAC.3
MVGARVRVRARVRARVSARVKIRARVRAGGAGVPRGGREVTAPRRAARTRQLAPWLGYGVGVGLGLAPQPAERHGAAAEHTWARVRDRVLGCAGSGLVWERVGVRVRFGLGLTLTLALAITLALSVAEHTVHGLLPSVAHTAHHVRRAARRTSQQ